MSFIPKRTSHGQTGSQAGALPCLAQGLETSPALRHRVKPSRPAGAATTAGATGHGGRMGDTR